MIDTFGRARAPRFMMFTGDAVTPIAASPQMIQSWTTELLALATGIDDASATMLQSYAFLAEVYPKIGLSLTDPGVGDTAWSPEKTQNVADAKAMADFASKVLRECANGDRVLGIFAGSGDWGVQAKPDDQYQIVLDPATGAPGLFKAGQVVHAPPGSLGILPLELAVIAAGLVWGAAVVGGAVYVLTSALETLGNIVDRVSDVQLTRAGLECAQSPNAQQCLAAIEAMKQKQVAVLDAEANKKGTPPGSAQAVTTAIGYGAIALSIAGLTYAAVKLVPPLLEERKASRKAA